MVGGNSRTEILDAQFHTITRVAAGGHVDALAACCILDCVLDQIPHDLLQLIMVSLDGQIAGEIEIDLHTGVASRLLQHLDSLPDDVV